MSKDTQQEFIGHIDKEEKILSSTFNISNKKLDINGYVTRISYTFGKKGLVEFLCGPPEFHAEIFISVVGEYKSLNRYNLMKLMSIPHLRNWVTQNKPDMSTMECPHFNGDFLSLKNERFPWEDTRKNLNQKQSL